MAIASSALMGCNVKEARDFFQARPIDMNTSIKVDTVPKIGAAGVTGTVEIDGVKVSEKTPFEQKSVTPGPHQIRISAKGYIGQEMEIDAKEGQATPLSLALQPMAGTKVPGAAVHTGGTGAGGKKGKDAPEAAPVASAEFSPHVVILTATPPTSVSVDGANVGVSTGLHMHLANATGEVVVGGGVSLTYFNRGNRVSVRPNVDSKSALTIDGAAATSTKGKTLELDQRPRRLEITSVEGARQVILLKLAE